MLLTVRPLGGRTSALSFLPPVCLVCVFLLLRSPCAGLALAAEQNTPPQKTQGLAYEPVIRGAPTEKLAELLKAVSKSFSLKNTPPESMLLLTRRMTGDVEPFMQVLRSFGYFKAKISPRLAPKEQPIGMLFEITPGPRFTWGRSDIIPRASAVDPPALPLPEAVGVQKGAPYAAAAVTAAESAVLSQLRTQSYPFPKIASRKVTANFKENNVSLILTVDAGKKAKFGHATFEGLERIKEDYARRFIPWRFGDAYDAKQTDKCRNDLIRSSLFSMARVEPGTVDARGYLPMTIHVVERKARTFGAGLRYKSDDGPGGKLQWEHRSLFGRGELLQMAVDGDRAQQSFETEFRKPDFFAQKQDMVANAKLLRERRDAYDSESGQLTVGIERALDSQLSVGLGTAYRMSNVTQDDDETRYTFVSFPAKLSWDTRDDLLDPSSGGLLSLWGAPYAPIAGIPSAFGQALVSYTRVLELVADKTLLLALRAKLGSSFGVTLRDLPADIRYFAGGMGSVRGFAHQYAGDLDDDDPVGGRSLADATAELRFRFYENYGFNLFVDAGRAYPDQFPSFSDPLFVGAGVGLRYYSPFGPVGLDLAVPLNRRSDTDAPFQFYITIGQSF